MAGRPTKASSLLEQARGVVSGGWTPDALAALPKNFSSVGAVLKAYGADFTDGDPVLTVRGGKKTNPLSVPVIQEALHRLDVAAGLTDHRIINGAWVTNFEKSKVKRDVLRLFDRAIKEAKEQEAAERSITTRRMNAIRRLTTVTPTTFEVNFARIGRFKNFEPVQFTVINVGQLQDAIQTHARRFLPPGEFSVFCDPSAGSGYLDGGRLGRFTFKAIK